LHNSFYTNTFVIRKKHIFLKKGLFKKKEQNRVNVVMTWKCFTLIMKTINLTIDNILVEVSEKLSIIESCELAGVVVPRFCYHEILSVSGNCRMCVVEVDTIEKPVASCATEAKGGMDVYTNNAFVKKARENVVEFLLLNHPLDCPICDQAGECDLQDQVKAYGSSQARFFGLKKTKEDRLCNPFIKTIMTRCITCTRCVRFATEIAGVEYFGTLNRGKNTEIGSYSEDLFISEISANVVDLCPVGALTSAPYAFHGRPWELRSTEAIDTVDALGSPIYVDHKENVIYRILPRSTEELKSSIIADVSRFSYENTKHNRILRSSKKENGYHLISVKDKNLQKECVSFLKKQIEKGLSVIIDETIDVESLIYLNFLKKSESKLDLLVLNKSNVTSENIIINEQYSIKNYFDSLKTSCFLVGVNLRIENAVINSKLRFKYRTSDVKVITSGFNYDNNIPNRLLYLNLSDTLTSFEGLYEGLAQNYTKNKETMIIFGENFFNRMKNYYTIKGILKRLNISNKILELYNHCNSEFVKMVKLRRINGEKKMKVNKNSNLYLNVEDSISVRKLYNFAKEKSSVWVNSNKSELSNKSYYSFPSKTYLEESFSLISLGYRHQVSNKSGEVQPMIQKLSNVVSNLLPSGKIYKKATFLTNTFLTDIEAIENEHNYYRYNQNFVSIYNKYPIKQWIRNPYNNNKQAQNSKTLEEALKTYNAVYRNL
jgi:NADH-quinone oxidoreductase subunit G